MTKMKYLILPLLYFTLVTYFINDISALSNEGIIGGHLASKHSFKFVASVQAKRHFSNAFYILCTAVIIHEYYLLSATHCFVTTSNFLQNQTYSVVVGTHDLNTVTKRISVDRIYLPGFDSTFDTFNIAVVKVEKAMGVYSDLNVNLVKLPIVGEVFDEKQATVAGFGVSQLFTQSVLNYDLLPIAAGGSCMELKFASVSITNSDECVGYYAGIDTVRQFCGSIIVEEDGETWGVCAGDNGSPLIINETVYGIAGKHPINCDDSIGGTLYSKVSIFMQFINSILSGTTPDYAMTHINTFEEEAQSGSEKETRVGLDLSYTEKDKQ